MYIKFKLKNYQKEVNLGIEISEAHENGDVFHVHFHEGSYSTWSGVGYHDEHLHAMKTHLLL